MTMMKLRERIELARITAEVEDVTGYVPMPEDMMAGSRAFRVTLTNASNGESMIVPFYSGPGIDQYPTAADVLDCLTSDAAGFRNARSFEEWAADYGYDEDSRAAEQVYDGIAAADGDLSRFLGDELDAFLWETEGL